MGEMEGILVNWCSIGCGSGLCQLPSALALTPRLASAKYFLECQGSEISIVYLIELSRRLRLNKQGFSVSSILRWEVKGKWFHLRANIGLVDVVDA